VRPAGKARVAERGGATHKTRHAAGGPHPPGPEGCCRARPHPRRPLWPWNHPARQRPPWCGCARNQRGCGSLLGGSPGAMPAPDRARQTVLAWNAARAWPWLRSVFWRRASANGAIGVAAGRCLGESGLAAGAAGGGSWRRGAGRRI